MPEGLDDRINELINEELKHSLIVGLLHPIQVKNIINTIVQEVIENGKQHTDSQSKSS